MRKAVLICAGAVLAVSAVLLAGRLTKVDDKVSASGISKLDVQLDLTAGRFEINPGRIPEGAVITYQGQYDESKYDFTQEFDQRQDNGKFTFSSEVKRSHSNSIDGEKNSWEFSFSPDVDCRFDIEIGAAETSFDFSDLKVSELSLEIGAADATIDFATPNKTRMVDLKIDAGACELDINNLANARFELLTFEGGMGDFTLDFTGKFDYEAEAQINVGMGSIDIILPADIAVRLETEENWFNSIDIPKRRFDKVRGRDGVWETENWDSASGRLTLILDVGMGSADIRFR